MDLRLRKADENDVDFIYELANDKDTRANSFNKDFIPYESHIKWFEKKLQDENCDFFILICERERVGQIRIDWQNDIGEISYSISNKFRGKGFGSRIIELAIKEYSHKTFVGKVIAGNEASKRCFLKNGFIMKEEEKYYTFVKEVDGLKKSIAIITARGGSKRIPKKNIKNFLGKPILAYSIEAALNCGCFDEVMVSTDSEEIAQVARKFGAKVPFMRSEKTSDDFATTADVLNEVIEEYSKRGFEFETMACIYPTAPFISAKKLKKAMELLSEGDNIMAMPVVAFSYPPQRGYVFNGDTIEMQCKENYEKRSQDLEKMYHDAGQFYCYKIDAFRENNGRIKEGICPIVLDELEVQDIDNETDWKLAELKYKLIHE